MSSSVKTAPEGQEAPSPGDPAGGRRALRPARGRLARLRNVHLGKLTASTLAGLAAISLGVAAGTSSSGAVLTHRLPHSATHAAARSVPISAISSMLYTNFDHLHRGAITPDEFSRVLRDPTVGFSDLDDTSVVPDGHGGSALRVELQANTIHNEPKGNNGINAFVPLSRVVSNACVSYDVRFDQQFDWSLGGKLPGLLGVAPGVEPGLPTGGNVLRGLGWSGRMMWVGPGAYSMPGRTNMAISYLYHPTQPNRWGDNVRWNESFTPGQWHQVRQCYTMNTVGLRDGKLSAWFDGRQVLDRQHVVYRTREDVGITHLAWSVFRGGHTTAWAAAKSDHIDFDNVEVTTRNP